MDEPIDHSDQIAALKISIDFLKEWDLEGRWQNFHLFRKWERSHYSLSHLEMDILSAEMSFWAELAKKQMFAKKNVQMSLFE